MIRIGVDLGGTKIEAAGLDTDGRTLFRERIATPQNYKQGLEAIIGLIRKAESMLGPAIGVGIGHPGSFSPETGVLRGANSTWHNGRDFQCDLTEVFGRPIRFANDADCFALSEAVDGAGMGHSKIFGVILGTGVGGGIISDGEPYSGAQNIAGEWGHNSLPWVTADEFPGPVCWCGQVGCIETWLSGPGVARDFIDRTGESMQAIEILQRPEELARYTRRLAKALSTAINILDPDVIVLGGGVSNAPGLADATQDALQGHVFSDVIRTRILRHAHGDSSGVRGAAMLWPSSPS